MILLLLDRYLVWISLGGVAALWVLSGWVGLEISAGAQEALTMFTGYAMLKSRTDSRWRELEAKDQKMSELAESFDVAPPGSPEALEARRELVALARRSDGGQDDE